ncbi:MAG: DVUA0089 family protein, partial [Planctomycetaceae bacterium]
TYVSDQFLGDGDSWEWDVDVFRFNAPAGARLSVETQPGVDASPVDTGLRLFDTFGNELAFDDDSGTDYFSYLEYTLQQTGVYYIGVSGYPNYEYDPQTGESTTYGDVGAYRITASVAIDVGDTLANAWNTQIGPIPGDQPFVMDQAIGNGFAAERDVDLYRFEASEHTLAVIALTPQPAGQSMDTMLRLFDATGNELAANDDHNDLYSQLEYSIAESGTYYFGVSGYPRGDYDPHSEHADDNTTGGSVGDYRVHFSLLEDPDPGQRLAHARETGLCPEEPQFEIHETIGNGSAGDSDVDLYHLVGQAGTLLGIGVEPRHNDGQIETRIRVFDSMGSELATSETIYERDGTPFSRLGYLIPADGYYFVGISGFSNSDYDPADGSGLGAAATGAYELDITFVEDVGNTLSDALDVDFSAGRFDQKNFVGDGSWSDSDVDMFRVVAEDRQSLAVRLTAPYADVQLLTGVARVFDAQGTEIASSMNAHGEHSDTLLTVLPTAGDYYVSVSGLGNSQFDALDGQHRTTGDVGGYQISLDSAPDIGDTIAAARVLTDQDQHHAELGAGDLDTNDVDMYAIDVAAGEVLTAHTGPSDNSRELDTVLRLFDDAGREIAFNDDAGSGSLFSRLVHTVEDAGRYYLGVSAYTNENYDPLTADHAVVAAGGRYAVDVRLRDELHDSQQLEFAADMTVSISGSIDESFDTDIYRLTIPETGMYTFRQDAALDSGLDSLLHIFDAASRQRLAMNDDGGGGLNSRIDLRLESGQTVFMRSHAFGDSTGDYVFSIHQSALVAEDDFGASITSAHPLALNTGERTRQLGQIETPYDVDFFSITAPADGMLAVGQQAAPGGALDSLLKLLDDQGNLIVENDDSANSRNSRILVPVEMGQQLYLAAGGYADATGHYAVWTELLPPAVDDVGDNSDTAYDLMIDGSGRASFSGQLEHQGDLDVFRLDINVSGLMIASHRADDVEALDPLLRAYDAAGEEVAWDDDTGEGLNAMMCLAVQAGDVVFIHAGSYEDAGSGTYHLDVSIDSRRNIADDFGETIDAIADDVPTQMTFGAGSITISAAIDLPHDTDLFAIDIDPTAPSDAAITIEQRGVWSAGSGNILDPTLRVYNQNMQELAYNDDSGFSLDSRLTLPVAASTRLYVQAGAYGASTGRYDLVLNMISDDAGDTVDDARRLPTDGSGTTLWNGTIGTEFERDVLRFTAESNGRLQIRQNGLGADPVDSFLSVYLESSSGELEFVAVSDDVGDSLDSLVEVEVKADDVLYLFAGGFADSTGDYQIDIQTVAADDIGNNLADAWQLDLNTSGAVDIGASINAGGDRDVFVVTADRHGTLTVQLDHNASLDARLSLLQVQDGEPLRIGSDAGDTG